MHRIIVVDGSAIKIANLTFDLGTKRRFKINLNPYQIGCEENFAQQQGHDAAACTVPRTRTLKPNTTILKFESLHKKTLISKLETQILRSAT